VYSDEDIMKKIIVGILLLAVSAQASVEIYVSPTGDDRAPGSEQSPVATIVQAKLLAREHSGAVEVYLTSGTYFLDQPLQFGPEDSHTSYIGPDDGSACISGGYRIEGWKQIPESPLWSAKVPPELTENGQWQCNALWVNGTRQVIARWPNISEGDARYRDVLEGGLSKDFLSYTVKVQDVEPLRGCESFETVRFRGSKVWATTHKGIASVDYETGTVFLKSPHAPVPRHLQSKARDVYFFENDVSFLDEPGEWFYNPRTETITYWPAEGVEMASAAVVVPVHSQLVCVEGGAEGPVTGLHFRNLIFSHTMFTYEPEGYEGGQACNVLLINKEMQEKFTRSRYPAAMEWRYAESNSVVGCEFTHLGASALDLLIGVHYNTVEGGHFHDVGGNAVTVGVNHEDPEQPNGNRVANCYIHDCGTTFFGAVGIYGVFAANTTIEHNTVAYMPYSGVSLGWRWDATPTSIENYRLIANHIYDVQREVQDGGGIYTLGYQRGTVIHDNVIHSIKKAPTHHWPAARAIFFDEGSKAYDFDGNITFDCIHHITYNKSKKDFMIWGDSNLIGLSRDELTGHEKALKTAGLEPEWAERWLPEHERREQVLPQPRTDITLYADEEVLPLNERIHPLCFEHPTHTPEQILVLLGLDPKRLRYAGDQGLANTVQLGRRRITHWRVSQNYDLWMVEMMQDDGSFKMRGGHVLGRKRPWPLLPPYYLHP
jgi:hypothetical protein